MLSLREYLYNSESQCYMYGSFWRYPQLFAGCLAELHNYIRAMYVRFDGNEVDETVEIGRIRYPRDLCVMVVSFENRIDVDYLPVTGQLTEVQLAQNNIHSKITPDIFIYSDPYKFDEYGNIVIDEIRYLINFSIQHPQLEYLCYGLFCKNKTTNRNESIYPD